MKLFDILRLFWTPPEDRRADLVELGQAFRNDKITESQAIICAYHMGKENGIKQAREVKEDADVG